MARERLEQVARAHGGSAAGSAARGVAGAAAKARGAAEEWSGQEEGG